VPAAFEESLHLVRPGGTIVEAGNVLIKPEFNINIIPGMIVRNCLTVVGMVRYLPNYLNKGLKFVERTYQKYPYGNLSDRSYTLDETQYALEKAAAREVKRAAIKPNA